MCVAAQLFPWPGEDLAPTFTGHFYALPKVGTENPNTEAVLPPAVLFPAAAVHPQIFWVFSSLQ